MTDEHTELAAAKADLGRVTAELEDIQLLLASAEHGLQHETERAYKLSERLRTVWADLKIERDRAEKAEAEVLRLTRDLEDARADYARELAEHGRTQQEKGYAIEQAESAEAAVMRMVNTVAALRRRPQSAHDIDAQDRIDALHERIAAQGRALAETKEHIENMQAVCVEAVREVEDGDVPMRLQDAVAQLLGFVGRTHEKEFMEACRDYVNKHYKESGSLRAYLLGDLDGVYDVVAAYSAPQAICILRERGRGDVGTKVRLLTKDARNMMLLFGSDGAAIGTVDTVLGECSNPKWLAGGRG